MDDELDYYEPDDDPEPELKEKEINIIATKLNIEYHKIDHIFIRIENLIKMISENYGISYGLSLKILNDNNWDLQKSENYIKDVYTYEGVNQNEPTEMNCLICYMQFQNIEEIEKLECKHIFCKDCIRQYLLESIKDGVNGLVKQCPFQGCKEPLNYLLYDKYFHFESDKLKKYQNNLSENFVFKSCQFKFCSNPKCDLIIEFKDKNAKNMLKPRNVKCECNNCFCLLCDKEGHLPCNCAVYADWMKLFTGQDQSINENWMKLNTKNCPKCKVNIEKNQGCMHMTCKMCKYEFCWICLADYKTHGSGTGGFYKCNLYKENEEELKKLNQLQKEMKKFEFYSERFLAHKVSIDLATAKIKRFKESKAKSIFSNSYEDLCAAFDLIAEARRAIAFTYPIGFFLKNKKNLILFEFLQGDLEKYLEILDETTDKNFENNDDFENNDLLKKKWVNEVKDLSRIIFDYSEKVLVFLSDLEKNLESMKIESMQLQIQKSISYEYENNFEVDEHWICKACTYANEKHLNRCEMCDTQRINT